MSGSFGARFFKRVERGYIKRSSIYIAGLAIVVGAALCLFYSPKLRQSIARAIGKSSPPNIIFITADTLRLDHLGVGGYSRATSPNIDRLARDSIVFSNAFTVIPKTTPSLLSMFSGLYPKEHGVAQLWTAVDPRVILLPQALSARGYTTAGFCGQINCSRALGLAKGFDHYEDTFAIQPFEKAKLEGLDYSRGFNPEVERRAGDLVNAAARWLARHVREKPGTPFFIWIHFMDPHGGYNPPAPYGWRFSDGMQIRPLSAENSVRPASFWGRSLPWELINFQVRVGSITDYDFYVNHYDGEVAYLDSQIGRFLKGLKDLGFYERAAIVFTADHGEYMGEVMSRGCIFCHGDTLHDSEIRVPLLIKLPDARDGGLRREEPVSTVTLAPALLDFLWQSQQGRCQSEMPCLEEAAGLFSAAPPRNPRNVFIELSLPQATFAVRSRNTKVVLKTSLLREEFFQRIKESGDLSMTLSCFDLQRDPLERTALSLADCAEGQNLSEELFAWLRSERREGVPFVATPLTQNADSIEALRSLGYIN